MCLSVMEGPAEETLPTTSTSQVVPSRLVQALFIYLLFLSRIRDFRGPDPKGHEPKASVWYAGSGAEPWLLLYGRLAQPYEAFLHVLLSVDSSV